MSVYCPLELNHLSKSIPIVQIASLCSISFARSREDSLPKVNIKVFCRHFGGQASYSSLMLSMYGFSDSTALSWPFCDHRLFAIRSWLMIRFRLLISDINDLSLLNSTTFSTQEL